jgi:hypothetical protein
MCLWRRKNWCPVSLASAIGQRRSDFALAVLYLSDLICCQCFRSTCLSVVNFAFEVWTPLYVCQNCIMLSLQRFGLFMRTRDLWQRFVNLCTSTGTTLPRSILMRRMLFDLSLSTSVYNFFIVHFSDACFHSFCFDYFCKHVHCPQSNCMIVILCIYANKAYSILFYSTIVSPSHIFFGDNARL